MTDKQMNQTSHEGFESSDIWQEMTGEPPGHTLAKPLADNMLIQIVTFWKFDFEGIKHRHFPCRLMGFKVVNLFSLTKSSFN